MEEVKIRPTLKDLDSDKTVRALYRRWCRHYNRRRTPEEMIKRFNIGERFNIFEKNAREVFKVNQMDPSYQFHLSSSCDEKDLFDWSVVEDMTPTPTERDMKSDEAVMDLYYRWCLYHKILRTPEEMQQRVKYFKKSAIHAIEMNEKDPSCLSKWCDKIDLRGWSGGEEDMTLIPTKGDLESDDDLMKLYRRWCLHHRIDRTPDEMELRFTTFKNTVALVFGMSQKDSSMQYCLSFGCDETDQPIREVVVVPTERDLKSGNALLSLYRRYCIYHWCHMTPELMKEGFNTFKKCVKYVFEKNKKDSSCQFCLAGVCHGREEFMPYEPDGNVFIRIRPNRWDMESDEKVWVLYRRWCIHHKQRRTPEEIRERFDVFKKHAQEVLRITLSVQTSTPCHSGPMDQTCVVAIRSYNFGVYVNIVLDHLNIFYHDLICSVLMLSSSLSSSYIYAFILTWYQLHNLIPCGLSATFS